jgi:hypothetical protein
MNEEAISLLRGMLTAIEAQTKQIEKLNSNIEVLNDNISFRMGYQTDVTRECLKTLPRFEERITQETHSVQEKIVNLINDSNNNTIEIRKALLENAKTTTENFILLAKQIAALPMINPEALGKNFILISDQLKSLDSSVKGIKPQPIIDQLKTLDSSIKEIKAPGSNTNNANASTEKLYKLAETKTNAILKEQIDLFNMVNAKALEISRIVNSIDSRLLYHFMR